MLVNHAVAAGEHGAGRDGAITDTAAEPIVDGDEVIEPDLAGLEHLGRDLADDRAALDVQLGVVADNRGVSRVLAGVDDAVADDQGRGPGDLEPGADTVVDADVGADPDVDEESIVGG